MGKGKAGDLSSSRQPCCRPEAAGVAESHAAAQWLTMLAGEYRMRRRALDLDQQQPLLDCADRLDALAKADPLLLLGEAELLRDVSFQLALWDCDPNRPGKGTWLTLAADDLTRLVALVAPVG
jgi:hypothetical protein